MQAVRFVGVGQAARIEGGGDDAPGSDVDVHAPR